jgi:hypothetical protein
MRSVQEQVHSHFKNASAFPFSNLHVRGFEAVLFAVATDFPNAIVGFAKGYDDGV